MAVMNFGGVDENVVTREEFPLEKAREVLKDEVIAVIGYGVQGPDSALVKPMTKLLPTAGYRVKHCSVLKKLAKEQLSYRCCFPTPLRSNAGRVSKNI